MICSSLQDLGEFSEVFLLSSNRKQFYQNIDLKNISIIAEHGLYYKQKENSSKWVDLIKNDQNWRQVVLKIFDYYCQRTEGSYIEQRESSILWKYSQLQIELGQYQAQELYFHLKSVLEHIQEVQIIKNKFSIEVRPNNIDRNIFINLLIKYYHQKHINSKIDFLFIVSSLENE